MASVHPPGTRDQTTEVRAVTRNAEVAEILEEFADLLDADDVEFKPRSYRRAAENILDHPVAIEELAAEGPDAVQEIEGVGEAIAAKVVAYLTDGRIDELDELRSELPVQMDELTAVEGVGPKTVGALYRALGITTLEELEAAAKAGEIRSVKGFGAKTEANIIEHIPFAKEASGRELLGHARPVADEMLTYLAEELPDARAEVAGSIRRWKPTIGDIDILLATETPAEAIEAFTAWPRTDSVIESGENKASIRGRGTRIDLRVVAPSEYGSALQYFTGSRDHNVRLRNRAIRLGRKMNEYGVFDVSDLDSDATSNDRRAGHRVAGDTEESMYGALDLPWIPPELRQDRGEIDAAEKGELPELVATDDIRGDLHTHTTWSDGRETIAELAATADTFGHTYLAICDHATGPGMVGGVGLSDDELREQRDAIRAVDAETEIRVMAGVETNIDADGELSTADDVLETLDIVVASPHSSLDQDTTAATERLIAAASHPHVDIIGHPTGRMLNRRPGLDISIEEVATTAATHDVALEVNANPSRLDLDGGMVRVAIEAGARIAINTDAHSPTEFANMRYGVHTARRGWAAADQIVNTYSLDRLERFLGL